MDHQHRSSVSSNGTIAIVRISGNLNLANAPLVENQIIDLLSNEYGEEDESELLQQPSTIILDLSCVSHIDPSACRTFEAMHRNFQKRIQDLHYVGIRASVWRRMEDMKSFKTIPKGQCYPTLQDALAHQNGLP